MSHFVSAQDLTLKGKPYVDQWPNKKVTDKIND